MGVASLLVSLKLIAYLGYTDRILCGTPLSTLMCFVFQLYIYTKAVPPSIHFLKYARLAYPASHYFIKSSRSVLFSAHSLGVSSSGIRVRSRPCIQVPAYLDAPPLRLQRFRQLLLQVCIPPGKGGRCGGRSAQASWFVQYLGKLGEQQGWCCGCCGRRGRWGDGWRGGRGGWRGARGGWHDRGR